MPNDGRPLTCAEALRFLADFLDRELDASLEQEVHAHLERCRSCFSRAEFERRLKLELATLRDAPVSQEFEARVRGIIRAFQPS